MRLNIFKPLCLLVLLLLSALSARATVILQYHHISQTTPAATSLSPELFRQHIAELLASNYKVLSLPQVVADLKAGNKLPDKSVVITFDDGYDSVYTAAFPLLKKHKLPFTVFVNTEPLETGLAGFASWEQLRDMAKHGATIANHSHTHSHFLRRLDNETERQWRDRIRDDIETAETIITEHTGQHHKLLAYPYGEYDEAVKRIVDDLGYVAFGQQSGPIAENPEVLDILALPRFPFGGNYGAIDDFRIKVATLAMPIRSARAFGKKGNQQLKDVVLPAGETQPTLAIQLSDALKTQVQCFASGQGAINVETTEQGFIAKPNRALPIGRSRYNCTASSSERGRFYWYSHFFIRKQTDGSWYPEP